MRISKMVLAGAFFVLVPGWSLIVPFHGGPDESTHLFLVEYLYKFAAFPVPHVDPIQPFVGELSGREINNQQHWYYGLPYVYSLGGTLLAYLFGGFLPHGMGFLTARAFNWFLAPIFALSLVSIATRCGVGSAKAFVMASIILLIPQVAFIFSYFNSDALGLAASTAATASFLGVLATPTRRRCVMFGALCGLILCTKIYYYPALVFFAAMASLAMYLSPAFPAARVAVWSIAGAAFIAVPVLTITYLQFGDITSLEGAQKFANDSKAVKQCYLMCETGLIDIRNIRQWLQTAFYSFFAIVGWMDVLIPRGFYTFFFKPLSIAVVAWGAVMSTRDARRALRGDSAALRLPAIFFLLIGMLACVILFNLIGSQRLMPQAQGRYLFVVIPFTLLLTATLVGNRPPINHLAGPIIRDRQLILFAAIAAVMAITNLLAANALMEKAGEMNALPIVRLWARE